MSLPNFLVGENHPNFSEWAYGMPGVNDWVVWTKPAGCEMAFMIVIGSGSGGAGGNTGTARGGGGGASGGMVKYCVPLDLLPDRLYIRVGVGGAAGLSNADGGDGSRSYISIAPSTAAASVILVSENASAVGGKVSSGTAGVAATVASVTGGIFGAFGTWVAIGGVNGSAGGSGGGANAPALNAHPIDGGRGGGAGNNRGGDVQAAGGIPLITGGAGATSGTGGTGPSGWTIKNPSWGWIFSGAAGGGGATSGTGGVGGNGALGSGGGGGGGAGTGTGGAGGRGGDGYAAIVCW